MSYLHCTFLDEDAFNLIANINIIVSTLEMVKKTGQGQLQPRHEISTFTSTTNISRPSSVFFQIYLIFTFRLPVITFSRFFIIRWNTMSVRQIKAFR